MTLAEQLARYAHDLQYTDLGPEVIQAARQRMVDTVGCALGAIDSPPVVAIRAYTDTLPAGPSTVFFSDRRVSPEAATFLNATMVRFLDYNDGYFTKEPGHSSDNIPACLAVAQAEGRSGEELIVAMVIAYEVQMRFQDAASLFRRGWDHVNYVTISATLAVGRLLGLTVEQHVHALGMAINGHIALRQVRSGELSGWKGASAANASRNAIFCANLARHGMTGPSRIFEGEMGFFNQITGPCEIDVPAFGNAENQAYKILEIRTKLYPTNGEMQTAVLAATELRKQIDRLDDIEAIEIDTTDVGYRILAKDRAKWRPTTRETADHSLPYTVARALMDGTITRATYDQADFSDPAVLALVDRVTVKEDPDLTAQMPSLANRVTIVMKDGRRVSDEFGTRAKPKVVVSDETIAEKFRGFAAGRFDADAIARVFEACANLESRQGVPALLAALGLATPAR